MRGRLRAAAQHGGGDGGGGGDHGAAYDDPDHGYGVADLLDDPGREGRGLDTAGLPTVGRRLPEEPRRGRGAVAVVLTLVGIVTVLLVLIAGRALIQQGSTPDQVAVPQVNGLSADAARAR